MGLFDLEKYGSGKRGARTGRTSPEKRHKKAPGEGGEHDEAGNDEAGAGGNADRLTEPRAPRPDHGAVEGRGAGDKGSSRAHRAPGSESGSRIAPPRLRRPALRSASGDGQCSYTPAPSRALYGLVARPALSCPSDNTQSGSNNRNGQSDNGNPAFDNTQSGSRAKTESVFVFMLHERDSRGAGAILRRRIMRFEITKINGRERAALGAAPRPVKIFLPAVQFMLDNVPHI